MRLDTSTEFFRPHERNPEKTKSAQDFFQKAEELKAQKVRVSVREEQRESYLQRPKITGIDYFNLFAAFSEEDGTFVIYEERYEDGFLSREEMDDVNKRLKMVWNCVATAKNRLNLCPEQMGASIQSSVANYDKGNFLLLVDQIKKANAHPLTVKRG
ncbi:MAG: hypothetical protein A2152_01690 [Candidatus Levybacteria bacterium RBG_16_35_6]|nr:MAG: hypothetical protein A2152_01690 [Candidatus Levybacteria bacterium RBG_16_35_6]